MEEMRVHEVSATQKLLAKALGALWIFDGLLQFQSQMFGPNFVTNILTPLLANQPAYMAMVVQWGIHLWYTNMVVNNTAAALLQVLIGILILVPFSRRTYIAGLWLSSIWGAVVWLCGEGAGQLLTGSASFYTGAPGAVLIYMLIAGLLLVPEVSEKWYPKIAGALCVFGAFLQLLPSLWTTDGVQGTFMTAMGDSVHLVSFLPTALSAIVAIHPVLSNALLILLLLGVGLALLLKPTRIMGIVSLVFLFFVWWLGQDFGQLSTLFYGTATDPNTAPLIALLVLPLILPHGFSSSDRLHQPS